ncbi:hypothetical protein LTR08_002068 [Meristemomyces frigidus]|nr:hypothetical protein LTR08_002068 [Meristemomyces frigidus]
MSRLPSNGYRSVSTTQSLRPSSPGASPAAMSRAERFEDEKRRIIESCFSKLDANGQLAESYITHIRITEDAQYPSSPPPPEAAPENKKPRLIIIAVRSTGRVRMHKARENTNGSFSIGKTWNLEELSGIESFASAAVPPADERERSYREWAGGVGFTVTITKPYYWQAGTSKEKDFFIASAVKIYRKYTKGQVPELKGFDERDRAMMLGILPGALQAGPPGQTVSPGQRAESRAGSRVGSRDATNDVPAPPQPPFAHRDQSRDGSRYRGSPGPPASLHDPNRPGSSRQPSESRIGTTLPPPAGPRAFASQEQMRVPSQDRFAQDNRPGTSPAPGYGRVPLPQQQGLPPPNAPYGQSRSQSPSVSSVASSREVTPRVLQVRQQSPTRQRSYQRSVDSVPEDRQIETAPAAETNGNASGAGMFAATRNRWMGQQQQPQSQTSFVGAPQLPPIETSQPLQASTVRSPVGGPMTGVSEASSGGVDLGDAAAVGALTSYWGPEPTPAAPTPPPPVIQEPASPPTPERSRLRPLMEGRNKSDASFDLRPPPLKQGIKTPEEGVSQYSTPREGGSGAQTPLMEEPQMIRPLSVEKKRQSVESTAGSGKLQMPGAFNATPVGPSPLSTPADTPGEERTEKESQLQQAEQEVEEGFRPGLGPMVKKRELANRFKKAASAAGAFRPRPGGAAEKILKAKAEREAGAGTSDADGVSGFVPRPGAASRQDSNLSVASTNVATAKEDLAVKAPVGLGVEGIQAQAQAQNPTVELSSPPVSPRKTRTRDTLTALDRPQRPQSVQLAEDSPTWQQDRSPQKGGHATQVSTEQGETRKTSVQITRRSSQQNRNLTALGIDPSLLQNLALPFEATLTTFGWNSPALNPDSLSQLELHLRREQSRLEAGSWVSSTDSQREQKVQEVDRLLDRAIQECDELEGLLTLYSVELGSLGEDVSFIEQQAQGLHVKSANQELLVRELERVLEGQRV